METKTKERKHTVRRHGKSGILETILLIADGFRFLPILFAESDESSDI